MPGKFDIFILKDGFLDLMLF